jgi:hypothetical protein
MFGDVAVKLLKLMGRRGTIPGAIAYEEIPEALRQLRAGIAAEEPAETGQPAGDDEDEGEERRVSLSARAFPLIEMLQAAEEEQAAVMWRDETGHAG